MTLLRRRKSSYAAGFGLMEIVVVVAIASAALVAFSQAGTLALRVLGTQRRALQGTFLAQEGLEAARLVRDGSSWADIGWRTDLQNPSRRYYPVVENGVWVLATSSPGLVQGFDRYVQFERVSRDGADNIVASGGTDDPGTRRVTAHASSTATDIALTTYLTNFISSIPGVSDAVAISYTGASTDASVATFPSDNAGDGDLVQTFTTVGAVSITRVALLLRRVSASPSDLYAELRTSPAGTVLGTSQLITGTTASSTASWISFYFPVPVPLAAATNYTIRLRSTPDSTAAGSGSASMVNWLYRQVAGSPYGAGVARRFVGRLSNPADPGEQLDQYDFGFKVYAAQ